MFGQVQLRPPRGSPHLQICPRELSSYMQASFSCVTGQGSISVHYFCFLQSFADKECSGKRECSVQMAYLVYVSSPCPRELSSYLQASFTCLSGQTQPLGSDKVSPVSQLCSCKATRMRSVLGGGTVRSRRGTWFTCTRRAHGNCPRIWRRPSRVFPVSVEKTGNYELRKALLSRKYHYLSREKDTLSHQDPLIFSIWLSLPFHFGKRICTQDCGVLASFFSSTKVC